MTAPDPVEFRLLALLAEAGRIPVWELAARAGMDVREVASRLAVLSTTGLPLGLCAECDPVRLRYALAGTQPWRAPPAPPVARTAGPPDPASTWGPPQTALWARGDPPAPRRRLGAIGQTLRHDGAGPGRMDVTLLEVVDPADSLLRAAGHRLADAERAVVVHTELTNRGGEQLSELPDQHLVLVAADGSTVAKAPLGLASRPPHRTGLPPGHTAGGHTVYVLPADTEITAVRWGACGGDDPHALIWSLVDQR